jgi:riboflavin biosynthesis pyrimidine reductase
MKNPVHMNPNRLLRLYPAPHEECALEGLYLDDPMGHPGSDAAPFVYTNFVSSLDGRIATENPRAGRRSAPPAITNPRDWRLFQELAARADALIVSAAFVRGLAGDESHAKLPVGKDPAFNDLHDWRRERGMPPQPAWVILGRSLDAALAERCRSLHRPIYFAVGDEVILEPSATVEATGARILVVGHGRHVEGRPLIDALAREGFRNIYSIAGPRVLHALLKDGVLHRLYLTHFHRLLGGQSFDTLLEGEPLDPPASFVPRSLYFDAGEAGAAGQYLAAYDRGSSLREQPIQEADPAG